MPDLCDGFLQEIRNHFGALWDRGEPTIVHSETGSGGRCLVVLEADEMRFKFYRAPDEAVVQLGASDAPPMDEQAQLLARHRDEIRGLFVSGGMRDVAERYAAHTQAMADEVMKRYRTLGGDNS